MKNVKMYFTRDVFYDDPTRPLYLAGHTYEIPENLVEKWLKRGAQIVAELPKESPIQKQAPSEPSEPIKPLTDTESEPVFPVEEEETPKSDKKKSSKGK